MKLWPFHSSACATVLTVGAALVGTMPTSVVAQESQDMSAADLPLMLEITWTLGPSLPQGLQDSEVGIVDGVLVSVGGFASGEEGVPGKPDNYPRGFLAKAWGLKLDAMDEGWQRLPDRPNAPRQGLFGAVVNDEFYSWGGFSYEKPYTYRDGYRLLQDSSRWKWKRAPNLPWNMSTAGVAVVDSKIYLVGGVDYDTKLWYTQSNASGGVARLGAQLIVFDPADPEAGWRQLPPCPGTPRYVHAVAAVGDDIYVIGGATGNDNEGARTYTVVDNWKYNVITREWTRVADMPVASANFPDGRVVYDDRYILLIGGYPYGQIMNPDGTVRDGYGTPTKHLDDVSLFSDIYVYDAEADIFGKATRLPLNNNLPSSIIQDNTLYMIGGEIERATIEGEHFGHHPDLLLIGTIRDVVIP